MVNLNPINLNLNNINNKLNKNGLKSQLKVRNCQIGQKSKTQLWAAQKNQL